MTDWRVERAKVIEPQAIECADVFLNTETGMYEVRTMSEVFAEYPTRAEAEQDLEAGA